MDDDSHGWLFDPTLAHRRVLAHRSGLDSAVSCVVSGVVWQDAEHFPLARLAVEIDALGAAAVSALARESSWELPRTAS